MATFAWSCEQWDAIESTTHYPYKVIPSILISLMMWVQSQLTMGGTESIWHYLELKYEGCLMMIKHHKLMISG